MLANVTEKFLRARDPMVFPPSVSSYSVSISAEAIAPMRTARLALPAALESATAGRKIQFLAGRLCAREAIEGLAPGAPEATLPRDADGCPVWPDGLVGSISHTERFATAAVARRCEARGLGVDVEPLMSGETAAEIARLVASEDEARRVAETAGLNRLEAITLVFSAKESLFKALYPETRTHFDFLDCEVASLDPAERRFTIRVGAPFDAVFGAAAFDGRYELAEDEVRTGVLVTPAQAGRPGLIRHAL